MHVKKSNKANLEKKRGMFLQIGFIVSLSVVLLAFEWTTIRTNIIDWENFDRGEVIEEMVEVTIHEKKLEIPKPQIIRPIIVPDDTELDGDEIEIDVEIKDDTKNNPDLFIDEIVEIVEEEPVPLYSVEEWPKFPGGQAVMMSFLGDNLKYTGAAHAINLEGTVYVRFIVWKDGSIRNIEIAREVGAGLDEEVIRVIKLMPKWSPGKQNGRDVSVIYNLPVKFKLN